MDVFKLLGRIALDNSDAMSGMDDTVSKAKDTESKLTKIFNKIGTVVATAFATDKIIAFGNACKDAYAEFTAEESAFAQIMGEYAGTAQKKLEGVADSTGTVSTRMTTHMTSLTAKFKGLGFGVEDATDMAASGLKMAADAAAFWDMSLDESTGHLNSFINGSYEGGEAIGLFANDTQMAMFAVKSGLIATTKEWSNLDEATKQATRLQYAQNMMEASGAIGQAAKEAGSLANVQANLTESWRKFKAVIGEPIVNNLVIPAMQKLNDLMPQITEATKTGIEWISTAFGTVKEAVKNLPETLTSAGTAISDTWTKTVYPAIQNAFKVVFGVEMPSWNELIIGISDGWNGIVWPNIRKFFATVFKVDIPSWEDITTSISNGWNNVVMPAITGFFKSVFKVEMPSWERTNGLIDDGWNKVIWPVISGYFKVAFGVSMPAWASIGLLISNGWTDVIQPVVQGLFKTDYEVETPSWENIKTAIADGWNKVILPAITGYFKTMFGVEMPSWEEAKTLITNGWNDAILPAIAGFFKTAFEVALPAWEDIKTLIADGWNKVIWPAVEGLFHTAFDVALPAWEDIKKLIDDGWNKVIWPAIQGFFKTAFEVALPLWDDIKTLIVDGWQDVIWPVIKDFFKTAFEVALPLWSDISTLISDGWTNVIWPVIQDLFKTAFEVALPMWEDIKDLINAGWTNVIWPVVQGIFKTFFAVELPDWTYIADLLDGAWSDALWPAIQDLFQTTFGINLPSWEEIAQTIKDWWAEVKKAVGDLVVDAAVNVTRSETVTTTYHTQQKQAEQNVGAAVQEKTGSNFWSTLAQGVANIFTVNPDAPWLPGHATGLDYVPFDNYVARLHEGEAVLTRTEAEAWRSGYGDTRRMEAILTNVENILQVVAQNTGANKQIVLDSGALVGQLAPGMDAQLGTISNRKGRRN